MKKNSAYRFSKLAKGALALALVALIPLYVLIDRPDYTTLSTLRGGVMPVFRAMGDLVSWPLRATGQMFSGLTDLGNIRKENRALVLRIAELESNIAVCTAENVQLMESVRIANAAPAMPTRAIFARVVHEYSASGHSSFLIDRGQSGGIRPGMAVVSAGGGLAGVITESFENMSRVRTLFDAKSNIPVRIEGSDIYGFLRGTGRGARLEVLSDPSFSPSKGIQLSTSGIKGTLPSGLPVGYVMDQKGNVSVDAPPNKILDAIALDFNKGDVYK